MDRCLLAPNLLLDKILLSILHFEGGKKELKVAKMLIYHWKINPSSLK